jgi:hypothetical protein
LRRWNSIAVCAGALKQALLAGLKFNLTGLVVWLVVFALNVAAAVFSALISIVCCFPACRQVAIRIGGQAGDIKVSLNAPADTEGRSMREFAVDIINVVRKAQEENVAKLRNAESGIAK